MGYLPQEPMDLAGMKCECKMPVWLSQTGTRIRKQQPYPHFPGIAESKLNASGLCTQTPRKPADL